MHCSYSEGDSDLLTCSTLQRSANSTSGSFDALFLLEVLFLDFLLGVLSLSALDKPFLFSIGWQLWWHWTACFCEKEKLLVRN